MPLSRFEAGTCLYSSKQKTLVSTAPNIALRPADVAVVMTYSGPIMKRAYNIYWNVLTKWPVRPSVHQKIIQGRDESMNLLSRCQKCLHNSCLTSLDDTQVFHWQFPFYRTYMAVRFLLCKWFLSASIIWRDVAQSSTRKLIIMQSRKNNTRPVE